jgi:hypothetical protein
MYSEAKLLLRFIIHPFNYKKLREGVIGETVGFP